MMHSMIARRHFNWWFTHRRRTFQKGWWIAFAPWRPKGSRWSRLLERMAYHRLEYLEVSAHSHSCPKVVLLLVPVAASRRRHKSSCGLTWHSQAKSIDFQTGQMPMWPVRRRLWFRLFAKNGSDPEKGREIFLLGRNYSAKKPMNGNGECRNPSC